MECRGVREKLSAYLEGLVAPDEQELLEQHLASCPACGEALRDLNRAGQLVRGLKEVEPPPEMTRRVMARIREEGRPRQGLLQKLFHPLHLKLPLQAFATALIAFAAVYVFKAVEPQMESARLPVPPSPTLTREEPLPAAPPPAASPLPGEKPLVAAEAARERGKDLAAEKREALPEEKPAAAPERKSSPPVEPPLLRAPAPQSPPRIPKEGPGPRTAEAPAPPQFQRQGESALRPPEADRASKMEDRLAAGAAPRPEAGELVKSRLASPSPKEPAGGKSQALSLTVQSADPGEAAGRVVALLRGLDARGIDRQTGQRTEVITAEIQTERIRELLEKLPPVGEVRVEGPRPDLAPGQTPVRIAITPSR